MRSGNLSHRIKFYAKQSVRDSYNASVDTWPIATITTRGEVRYVGGNRTLNNEEKFYAKSIELTVRYRSEIVETMRVQIDETNDLYQISYMEILGRKEALRLTIEKLGDGLAPTAIDAPEGLTASYDGENVNLTWANNSDGDPVAIERSTDGVNYVQIHQTAAATTSYKDEAVSESTRYFYRIRAVHQSNYSAYAAIDDVITELSLTGTGEMNSYITTVDLISGTNTITTSLTTAPHTITIWDSTGNEIGGGMTINAALVGGVYVLTIYSVDPVNNAVIYIVYKP